MILDSLRSKRRLADVLAVLALLVTTILYYRSLALTNSILVGFDTFTYFYPNEQFAANSLRSGVLPLWNPYLFSGVPFIANMQTAVFYPLNLVFLLFSVPRAYACSVVLHVFLAAAFTYLFCRLCLRLGPVGSMAGAFTFAFSGFEGSMVGHLNQLQAAAWLPLLLLLTRQAWERRSATYGILGGLALALQILAGHAQELYMTLATLFVFLIYEAYRTRPLQRSMLGRALPLLIVGIVGIGLASVQLVPTAELSMLSIRAGGLSYKEAVSFSFPPWMILKGLFPVYSDPQPFSEYMGYVGVVGLFLCLVAISTSLRKPFVLFFAVTVAISLFLALGQFNPLYPVAFKIIPGLGLFRVPARWLFLYTFSVSMLVGFGVSSFGERLDDRQTRRVITKLGVAVIAFLVVVALAFLISRSTFPSDMPSFQTMAIWAVSSLLALALTVTGLHMGRPVVRVFALPLILAELFAAGQFLDLNRANVPEAYTSMRPSAAYFLTDGSVYRVLALSENTFDPGDMAEIKSMLSKSLSPPQIYDFLVATKLKETLMPNIPMRYSIATLDGYDGGVLPLKRYVNLKQLLVGKTTPDARLREEIEGFPDNRLLALLNVKYVLMDRIRDAWVDGAYYDLALSSTLSATDDTLVLSSLPQFETTSTGIISHLVDGGAFPNGTPLAEVRITDTSGKVHELTLRAGDDTAEGRWAEESERGAIKHREARKAKAWKDDPVAWDYLGVLSLPEPVIPREIAIRYLQAKGQLVIKGISEIDDRTRTSVPLTLSDSYRLDYIGDVKIYKNEEAFPRAFVVREPVVVADDGEALKMLAAESFQPDRQVVLLKAEWPQQPELGLQPTSEASGTSPGHHAGKPAAEQGSAEIVTYEPSRVVVNTDLDSAGFLVLTDSYYPGWKAFVDGKESAVLRANYMFRAVALGPGRHVVEFRYVPASLTVGAAISLLTLLALVAFLIHNLRVCHAHTARQ